MQILCKPQNNPNPNKVNKAPLKIKIILPKKN